MPNSEFAREYDFEKRRKTLSIVLNLVHFNFPSFNFFKVTISRLVTPQYITKLKTTNIIHKFQQTSCFMSKINLFGPNGGYTNVHWCLTKFLLHYLYFVKSEWLSFTTVTKFNLSSVDPYILFPHSTLAICKNGLGWYG